LIATGRYCSSVVFKTIRFNHSRLPPNQRSANYNLMISATPREFQIPGVLSGVWLRDACDV
jgi:hypothetical protein